MRGSWRPNRTATYWPPRFFPVLLGCSTESLRAQPLWVLAFSTTSCLQIVWSPTAQSGAWAPPPRWVLAFSTASCHQLVWSPNWLIGGLRAPSAGCWLSLPHLVSNWLNFLGTQLYNSSTHTFFLWASQIALIQPIHGQGYTLLFFHRMHLLFIEVYFLFWQPGRVVGQYTTVGLW